MREIILIGLFDKEASPMSFASTGEVESNPVKSLKVVPLLLKFKVPLNGLKPIPKPKIL